MSIAAIILAAGASSRLGRPKQTVELGGETLVVRAIRTALAAQLSPVIAVVAEAGLIDPLEQLGATVLLNRRAYQGISTSIVTGVTWAKGLGATGTVVMTCDQIAVTPDHLRALCSQPETVTGSAYAGQTGVPAYFPASSFPSLLALQGDTGARKLLIDSRAILTESLALDVDTEADLERARAYLSSGASF